MKPRALARWIVGIPLLLLMVVFVLTNREPVRLGLFPLGELPFEVPLSLVLLAAAGLGYFLGGLHAWFGALRHRRAVRRAEAIVRLLEAKNQELRVARVGPGVAVSRAATLNERTAGQV